MGRLGVYEALSVRRAVQAMQCWVDARADLLDWVEVAAHDDGFFLGSITRVGARI